MTRPLNSTSLLTDSTGPLRLALLSDPHCWRLGVWPWQLVGKRLIGWLNLLFRRRSQFRPEAFGRAVERAQALGCQALICGGDLTQTALTSEFALAAAQLRRADLPAVIVPGNHDRYTHGAVWTRRFERTMADQGGVTAFPAVFDLTPQVRLLALDPCRPSLTAKGTLPPAQLEGLRRELARAKAETRAVVVVCHYPFSHPPDIIHPASHRLTNSAELFSTLRAHGRRLIFIHGHIHRTWVHQPADAPHLLCINPGSCGHIRDNAPFGMGLLELQLDLAANGRVIVVSHRQDATGVWQSKTMINGERRIEG